MRTDSPVALTDALGRAIERHGGTVRTGDAVERVVSGSHGVEVPTAGGECLRARAVVGAIDVRQVFGDVIGWDRLPGSLRKRVDRMSLAASAVVLFGTLSSDPSRLGLACETIVFDSIDHDATWAEVVAGRPAGTWVSTPTAVDPPAAGDPHRVVITSLVPAASDDDGVPPVVAPSDRERLTRTVLDRVERNAPGFGDAFTLLETATPATLHPCTGNSGGAAYGWANSPNQTAGKRLSHRLPVDHVYLAGHWVEEGTSSLRTLTSGRATAAMVAADLGAPEAIPEFGGPSFLTASRPRS